MPRYKIINKDYREVFGALSGVDTIFADPPDGIDLAYDVHNDKVNEDEYVQFLRDLLIDAVNLGQTTYISFNSKWLVHMGHLAYELKGQWPELESRFLIQGFSFGQCRTTDLANNYRPILRLRREDAPLFPSACRIESDRMKLGDKRANPAGRVPGDVWFSDFLEYARVVGNSKQRRSWHPTQLNEGVVEDCLLMSTPPGGIVIDPFAGTGTTMRVCKANGWGCTTMDVSEDYCRRIAEENGLPKVCDDPPIWLKDI